MKKYLSRLKAASFVGLAIALSSWTAHSDVPESDEVIKLGVNEWTTQQVVTQIAHQLLEQMGYNVESMTVGYYPQIEAMKQNDLTPTLELWPSNIGEGIFEALDAGELIHLGNHDISGGGQLYYGSWMEEQCPGLPDYTALHGCMDILVSPETAPKGRFVGYPADWGNVFYAERFDALGLDLEVIQAGGEGPLVAEMASAHARKAPIVIHFWEPHWAIAAYEMKVLGAPVWEEGCETDPAWGPNPDKTHDCNFAVQKGIFKAANPTIDTTWPAAGALLRELSFTNADASWMLTEVDQNGLSQAEAAAKWITENRDRANEWIDAANAGS
ncbi:MAG: ABC transporter substrate-binding protein [Alphaproteobacteria bacterium]|nr:ABC transporter substrate-binding protein [Alphaproteobacteria bacterium]